jgi:hypothetical protein
MRVYHYTSVVSINNIKASNKFYPSSFIRSDDSTYGTGWYFSDLPPDTQNDKLFRLLWGTNYPDPDIKNRVTAYLVFDIDDSLLKSCRSNVFKLDDKLIKDGVLDTSLEYTRTSDNKVVIRFVNHGQRNSGNNSGVLWNILGFLGLIGFGIGLISIFSGKE